MIIIQDQRSICS